LQGDQVRKQTLTEDYHQTKRGVFSMKHFVLVFILALYFVLTGCGSNEINQLQLEGAIGTLTSLAYTATPVNTPHPSEKMIVDIINANLQMPEDPLSKTLDATYRVVKVSFVPNISGIPTTLFIVIDCECARDGHCCNLEHTFVVITRAMKANPEIIVGTAQGFPSIIPQTILDLQIECFDHQSTMGTMSVSWPLMREYLIGAISGDQLGWEVRRLATQTP
jgi:hypothetical protein